MATTNTNKHRQNNHRRIPQSHTTQNKQRPIQENKWQSTMHNVEPNKTTTNTTNHPNKQSKRHTHSIQNARSNNTTTPPIPPKQANHSKRNRSKQRRNNTTTRRKHIHQEQIQRNNTIQPSMDTKIKTPTIKKTIPPTSKYTMYITQPI